MAIKMSEYKKTKHAGIKVHKDGIKFLFDVTINGKRYRNTKFKGAIAHTQADRLKSAYIAFNEFIEEAERLQTLVANPNATVNDYFENLKDQVSWNSNVQSKYKAYFRLYMKEQKPLPKKSKQEKSVYTPEPKNSFANMKIRDIKPQHFTNFNKRLKHLSLSRQKMAYEILQPLFNLAVEDEIILKTPIKKVHIPKRKQQEEKKMIVDAEAKYTRLYSTLNSLYKDNPHHLALFLFGFHGRRISEVLALRWEDISFNSNQYRVRKENSKINQDMIFTLPADVRVALEKFRDVEGKIFNVKYVDRHFPHIRKASGIPEFTYHWMRNLTVSALSSRGVNTADLSALLGHTDAGTLTKYLSLQRDSSSFNCDVASRKLLS